jgi:uncharacterized membrane protein YqgA involved in biofilm formation
VFGTFVNALAIVAGSLLGLLLRGGIPRAYADTVMQGVGLSVILIGFKSALSSDALLLVIGCIAAGGLLGEAMGIEDRLERLGNWMERRFAGSGDGISRGFVAASLLFCVGSMAIVGSLESGLTGNHQTLFAKSVLDGVSSVIFASTMGLGVVFSAGSVLLYQGTITLGAALVKPLLSPPVVAQMSAVGGLLIAALGFNILAFGKIKVGNLLPAVFLPVFWFALRGLWN